MADFIFRNNTIEQLFGNKDYQYSGYGDISFVPEDAEKFIWFYQVPFNPDKEALVKEVESYKETFNFVFSRIPETKTVIVLTLVDLYSVTCVKNDFRILNAVNNFNLFLTEKAANCKNLKIIDTNEFINSISGKPLIDWKFYFISQSSINPRLGSDFKKWFNRKIEEINSKRKKCLVLDLDNTLWGGVLGEDGIDGIKIGGDYPGKAFLFFQEALIEFAKSGVILTICSKNNESDVLEAWEKNPFIVLNQKYISAYKINWEDKATNIQKLAKELNIGLDSFVFVDDNPTERELIKTMLPMVEVPDFPEQPYELPLFVKSLSDKYFGIYAVTSEDKNKTKQYKANALRANEQAKFSNFDDYLKSLDIEIKIEKANKFNIPRIAQMTQKTNQFNLTTKRYTENDINSFWEKGYYIYCISVKDKFGDNGITGAVIISAEGGKADIDSLLLSCRILGKGIENAFIGTVLNLLRKEGIQLISATYIPTAKNILVKEFYEKNNFICISNSEGVKKYSLELKDEIKLAPFYNISIN